jgi:GH15 family glucan-1,4-alpha-glucosidase
VGNAAAQQSQHDAYGSIILAALPMFYDRRLPRLGDEGLFRLLESLGEKARTLAFEADNGIWEYRGRRRVHTHSTAMCWSGCQRLAAIATRLGPTDRVRSIERGRRSCSTCAAEGHGIRNAAHHSGARR